jgi:hypothetical protein
VYVLRHGLLDVLEGWERDVMSSRNDHVRTYARFLMTVHAVSLRVFGRMLPPLFITVLWYASLLVFLVACVTAMWLIWRLR